MAEPQYQMGRYEKRVQPARIPWDRLSQEEKDEIVENAKKRKEEEQRKANKKAADIMIGTQRTMENSWE